MKTKLFFLFLLPIFAMAQLTEVLTFTNTNSPGDEKNFSEDYVFGNKYYYINSNTSGSFLYALDGSSNPPEQIKNISSAAVLAATTTNPTGGMNFKSTSNYLYFTTATLVSSPTVEYELWRTDGTNAGTIKLLSYQSSSVNAININNLLKITNEKVDNTLNGNLMFTAYTPTGTRSLYKTDGTLAGTVLLESYPYSNIYDSYFYPLETVNGNFLFYKYNSPTYTPEIWKSNGTPSTATALTNSSGQVASFVRAYGKLGNKFYFSDATKMYSTDGNTFNLEETTPSGFYYSTISVFNKANEFYYTQETTGTNVTTRVYYVNGDFSNRVMIKEFTSEPFTYTDIYANDKGVLLSKKDKNSNTAVAQVFVEKNGATSTYTNFLNYDRNNYQDKLLEYKNTIYIGAKLKTDPTYIGNELWRADSQNSSLAFDVFPGNTVFGPPFNLTLANSTSPHHFFILNDKLYFIGSKTGTKLFSFNGDFTFNGSTSNDWSTNSNWNSSIAPIYSDNANIPTGFSPTISGNAFVNNLTVNSPINISSGNLNISGNLNLGAKITLNNNNLNLKGGNSTITNGNSTNYIITNGTGNVSVENLNTARGTVNLPIGTAANFNPISIANSGTSDTFSARVAEGNTSTKPSINATWEISEVVSGGSNVNLTFGWNQSQENSGFSRSSAKVGHFTGGNWIEENSGIVSGINPYTISASGITSFSPFSVINFSALGTTDFSKSKVQVYPNPFNENLNISTQENGLMYFYDASGKLVSTSFLMKGDNFLNKSSLKSGIYIYQIKNKNGEIVSSGKIIKK